MTEAVEVLNFEARLCKSELSEKILDTETPDDPHWEANPKITVRGKSCCMMHFTMEQIARNPWLSTFIHQGRIFRVYEIHEDGSFEFMSYFCDMLSVQRRDIELFDKKRGF